MAQLQGACQQRQKPAIFDLCFCYRHFMVFERLRFQNITVKPRIKRRIFKFLQLKVRHQKAPCLVETFSRLIRRKGLTVVIKPCFNRLFSIY